LSSIEHARSILDGFADHGSFPGYTGQNWNRRYREYMERLKSSKLADVAHVLHELLLIGRGKELSFGERRLLEQAMSLVSGELAVVLNNSEQAVRESIQRAFDVQKVQES
jgi:CarD family transcriptional regulator